MNQSEHKQSSKIQTTLETEEPEFQKIFLMCLQSFEPPEDENSDGDEIDYTEIKFVKAASKEEALEAQAKVFREAGFRECTESDGLHSHLPEWTDDWVNTTVAIYGLEDDEFWHYLQPGWEDCYAIPLTEWAQQNPLDAARIMEAAMAGSSDDHNAAAKQPVFMAAWEKHQLTAMSTSSPQKSCMHRSRSI